MEVKEKSKKRELIKTIAIIFLAVLLVLTFFSGTIMNYSLPEVATQMVSSGTINAKIRGSGAVSANESYEVSIGQTREVRSVCVKVGDTVAEGDLLFVLGDMESDELKNAQEQLKTAQINYQRRMLELSKEYASDDQNIRIIREDLEKAIAQRDANAVTDEAVSFAKGDLAAAKSELEQIQVILKELAALQAENEEYAEAKAEVDALKSKVESLTSVVEDYEDQLDKLDSGESLDISRQIADARTALERAENSWKSDWLAYRNDLAELFASLPPEYSVGSLNVNTETPHTLTMNEQRYLEAYLTEMSSYDDGGGEGESGVLVDSAAIGRYKTAYETLLGDQNDVEAKNQTLQRLQQDSSIASGNAYEQRRAIQDKLDDAEAELRTAQRDLRDAQQRLDDASSANAQLKEQVRTYEASQRQLEARITTLENTLSELEEKQRVYKEALETIADKERELETALSGKDIDKQLDNLDLQAMSLDIQKYQELVDQYRADSVGTEIKAAVSGLISAINVSAGKETTPDQAMAVIDVVDRGYTVKISVTNDQAKNVKVGDTADVSNYYWGNELTAVLEQIIPDPASKGQNKFLVFRVTGEIDAGTNISLSIGQRSAPFDSIVPKSALREDTNGKFVLVVTSKSTPLGNRYTATRVDVQVLGEDDTSAAVSGLSSSDYVITTASKPITAGSQVRMVENP